MLIKVCAKSSAPFEVQNLRFKAWKIFKEKKKMRQPEKVGSSDILVLLLVSIAIWFLVFQSGLFN